MAAERKLLRRRCTVSLNMSRAARRMSMARSPWPRARTLVRDRCSNRNTTFTTSATIITTTADCCRYC
eukprot:scaffold34220_cov146-Isochrysis_galbana.AAC.3